MVSEQERQTRTVPQQEKWAAVTAFAPDGPPLPPPATVSRLWWAGCHGGAGTSTMAYLTGVGSDGGGQVLPPGPVPGEYTGVVLVCRASASGVAAAARTVGGWPLEAVSRPIVALVVVPASPRGCPDRVSVRLGEVAQWVPRRWAVPWDEGFLAADHLGQVRPSARVRDIAAVLRQMLPPVRHR